MAREYSEQYNNENIAYKTIIREYVKSRLLDPLKSYPTTISDTLIYIITTRLEDLYLYSVRFPEIVSPDINRLDILQAIVDQFEYTIREGSDLEEQVSILEHILHVYKKRGSIDTIENMWKYYGGNLPKDIKVKIPSYKLFRYSISTLSGTHVFQDSHNNRPGVYEIVLNNSTYPIPALKEFMMNELVAAGNKIYFTNSLYSLLVGDLSAYEYEVAVEDTFIHTDLKVVTHRSGMKWSGSESLSLLSKSPTWSGRADLFLELTQLLYIGHIDITDFSPIDSVLSTMMSNLGIITLISNISRHTILEYRELLSYTLNDDSSDLNRHLYDNAGNLLLSSYPGYFILGETLLGNEVI